MEEQPRKVFIARHAERLDYNFGITTWMQFCFDEHDEYYRSDLNMPYSLPKRSLGAKGYRMDSPLTQIGLFQATLIGKGMRDKNIKISHAFSSPGFRCIQTCNAILKGLNQSETIPICNEPGIFEYLYLYKESPDWLSISELKEDGYNMKEEYEPFIKPEVLKNTRESVEQYYNRSFDVMKKIINLTNEQGGGDILVVGHSATLEVCSRQLTGLGPRTYPEIFAIVQDIPYSALVVLEQKPVNEREPGAEWRLTDSSFLNFKHSRRQEFDMEVITNENLDNRIIEKNKNNFIKQVVASE